MNKITIKKIITISIILITTILTTKEVNAKTFEQATLEYFNETNIDYQVNQNSTHTIIKCTTQCHIDLFLNFNTFANSIKESRTHVIENKILNITNKTVNLGITVNKKTTYTKITLQNPIKQITTNIKNCNFSQFELITLQGTYNNLEIENKTILKNITKNQLQLQEPKLIKTILKKNNTLYHSYHNKSINCFTTLKTIINKTHLTIQTTNNKSEKITTIITNNNQSLIFQNKTKFPLTNSLKNILNKTHLIHYKSNTQEFLIKQDAYDFISKDITSTKTKNTKQTPTAITKYKVNKTIKKNSTKTNKTLNPSKKNNSKIKILNNIKNNTYKNKTKPIIHSYQTIIVLIIIIILTTLALIKILF